MKGKKGHEQPHTVFLSPQAQDVIAVARVLYGRPGAVWVFPSPHFVVPQPFGRATLAFAMVRALGKRLHVAHGWRSSMRTTLGRLHRRDRVLIEVMLAHQTKGQVERLYDRTDAHDFEAELRALWNEWGRLLLPPGSPDAWSVAGLADPAATNVVPLRRVA
jgi:integrase